MITAGIDMGSRSVKVVLLEEINVEGKPTFAVKKAHMMMPGDLDADQAADKAFGDALAVAGVTRDQVKSVFATGAGRGQVGFATEGITEMTAGAKGAVFMFPQARTIVAAAAASAVTWSRPAIWAIVTRRLALRWRNSSAIDATPVSLAASCRYSGICVRSTCEMK